MFGREWFSEGATDVERINLGLNVGPVLPTPACVQHLDVCGYLGILSWRENEDMTGDATAQPLAFRDNGPHVNIRKHHRIRKTLFALSSLFLTSR